ncbi:MAG TPA: sigma-70 family RNA polymerase sigma factor [Planctomycetaceae bacterium]|nr:sigma-70 family RNA polymerase sigma factor [Planctomycetaceae bacterium]
MDVTDSAVGLFHGMAEEPEEAADQFWRRCQGLLRRRAARWLRRWRIRGVDVDDLAASAFYLVWRRRCAGAFASIDSAERLRGLLLKVIDYKVFQQLRHQKRRKRGGGKELREQSAFAGRPSSLGGLDGVQDRSPQELPEETLLLIDSLDFLLERADEQMRQIVRMRIEGRSLEEIAEAAGCCVSTVVRKLRRAEDVWTRMLNR